MLKKKKKPSLKNNTKQFPTIWPETTPKPEAYELKFSLNPCTAAMNRGMGGLSRG